MRTREARTQHDFLPESISVLRNLAGAFPASRFD
jgi:hypothetical protein